MSDPFDFEEPEPAEPVPAPSFAYLDGLNPAQRQAVEALDGPVLVLAGAGTGKTRVLTTRLAHLLMTRRAAPFQVLAVTFTNKAAREMRQRVAALVGPAAEDLWLGTFHALAARLLRRHAELVGLQPNFSILDTDDQLRLIKQLLEAANVDSKKWPARVVLSTIERWKDRGLTPDKLSAQDGGTVANGQAVALYRGYQERLLALNACDFGDLLLHNLTVFQNHPDILARYHQRFRYLLVDEYQDANVAQYLWLRLLAQGHRNLCCVGDEDQSIYGWRGAEIGNILRFEHDFPGAQVIRLEENYRSTGHILGAASSLIARNQSRLGKTLWTGAGAGQPVTVQEHWDAEEEARWVVEEIEAEQRRGTPLNQIAILVRTGFQTREFEDRFIAAGVPYRVLGGLRFYERQEIRDALAYLRVIVQPADDLAFERILNVPKRGIGSATLQQLHQLARADGLPLTVAAERLAGTDELKPKMRQTVQRLMGDFARWRTLLESMNHPELVRLVLDESGYTRMWQEDKTPEAPGRLENLKELITALAEFENLQGFLEHVALVMEASEGPTNEVVTVMTLHGAKGLEFQVVFLPGWEEGLFPNQRALDETGLAGLEEERRLAYVGLTRARQRAIICHAGRRRLYGNWLDALPSRFLAELPAEHVEAGGSPRGAGGRSFHEVAAGFGAGGRGSPSYSAPYRAPAPARPPVIEGRARELPPAPAKGPGFRAGARVFHQKFGPGTVRTVEGDKLEIAFDQAGTKRVMASFVVPADQAG